jgi:hypothetical protein
MLACTILYLLPLLGYSRLFYQAAMLLALVVHGALIIIDAGGQIKLDKEVSVSFFVGRSSHFATPLPTRLFRFLSTS